MIGFHGSLCVNINSKIRKIFVVKILIYIPNQQEYLKIENIFKFLQNIFYFRLLNKFIIQYIEVTLVFFTITKFFPPFLKNLLNIYCAHHLEIKGK